MPTYDYQCVKCGVKFTRSCRVCDRDAQYCEWCGQVGQRIFVPCGQIFVPATFTAFSTDDVAERYKSN